MIELRAFKAVVLSLKYVAHAKTPSCPVESQAISEPNLHQTMSIKEAKERKIRTDTALQPI